VALCPLAISKIVSRNETPITPENKRFHALNKRISYVRIQQNSQRNSLTGLLETAVTVNICVKSKSDQNELKLQST